MVQAAVQLLLVLAVLAPCLHSLRPRLVSAGNARRLFDAADVAQATGARERDSVHIKLNEIGDGKSDEEEEEVEAPIPPGSAILTEVLCSSNSTLTLFACEGRMRWNLQRLTHFGAHVAGQNLSALLAEGKATVVERVYDLRLEETVRRLGALFRDERLLASSRDFPPPFVYASAPANSSARLNEERVFASKVLRYAQRIATLPSAAEDEAVRRFLSATGPGAMGGESGGESWVQHFASRRRAIRERLLAAERSAQARAQAQAQAEAQAQAQAQAEAQAEAEEKALLKSFLVAFRERLPYYYAQCLSEDCGCRDNNTYLGYAAARPHERAATRQAAVSELILCQACRRVTRFPRFNGLSGILRARRGRCGEYSVLLLRMLELLGVRARWVVDWSDHVWVEAQLTTTTAAGAGGGSRWVHCDPCEASVDEPLLYQGWGKNATYVLSMSREKRAGGGVAVEIEDVTCSYTSAGAEVVERRREAKGVNSTVVRAAIDDAHKHFVVV